MCRNKDKKKENIHQAAHETKKAAECIGIEDGPETI